MNQLESAFLKELTAGAEPELLLRSRTRIDAGRWWRRTPVWICVTDSELILFAVARRRFIDRVPLKHCHFSHYAAITGELVIEPAESLRIRHLALTPREALAALEILTK